MTWDKTQDGSLVEVCRGVATGVYRYRYIIPSQNQAVKHFMELNDVRTVIELVYTSQKILYLPKTNFWLRPWRFAFSGWFLVIGSVFAQAISSKYSIIHGRSQGKRGKTIVPQDSVTKILSQIIFLLRFTADSQGSWVPAKTSVPCNTNSWLAFAITGRGTSWCIYCFDR